MLINTKAAELSLQASFENILCISREAHLGVQNHTKICKVFHNFNMLAIK